MNLLVVRLGAMGDIIHALPAVAALHARFGPISWAVEPRWMPLLEGNPHIRQVIAIDRGRKLASFRHVRENVYDAAIDFQGLFKSALVAFLSGAERIYGFDRPFAREGGAAVFYTHRVMPRSAHVVERNLELARAAGASNAAAECWLPEGTPEGTLPEAPFVLASPFAGWGGKQWPLEHYRDLALRLREHGYELVLNVAEPMDVPGVCVHTSSIRGLIQATRRAAAVVGLDSGPLHLAAALRKPGVAIFGPTDPERNGPYGGSMTVLRCEDATTTYKRHAGTDASMSAITPDQVLAALLLRLGC
jgi:heptosyltransferase-1